MAKYLQTKSELLAHLSEQIEFLKLSSNSYDNNRFEGEAKRLATVIRVLVHDTSNSTSLLTLLGKKGILFYDSASNYNPGNVLPHNGLTAMKLGPNGAEYCAMLDNLPPSKDKDKKVSFDEWWGKIVYTDNEKNIFTRKGLVLAVANKEGGAHIDPELDQAYANLSRFNSQGWKFSKHGVEKDFENSPVLPSIRQITHEILKTLKDGFPDLF